jgi:hypothetical protein
VVVPLQLVSSKLARDSEFTHDAEAIMKKVLLLTIALLGLAATLAMADSMNMGYVCRQAANTATATTNDFNTGGAGVCDDGVSYTATKGFVCSFKNDTEMLNWGGTHVIVSIQTQTVPLPDFWNMAGCNAGALSAPNIVTSATNCQNMYIVTPTDAQSDNNQVTVDVATGRVIMDSFHVRNTTQITLPLPTQAGGYLANNIRMAPGTPDVCAGCADPACVILQSLEYFSTSVTRTITTPELRAFVTWNGGTTNCPGSTPTKNSTWGRVKALYR